MICDFGSERCVIVGLSGFLSVRNFHLQDYKHHTDDSVVHLVIASLLYIVNYFVLPIL